MNNNAKQTNPKISTCPVRLARVDQQCEHMTHYEIIFTIYFFITYKPNILMSYSDDESNELI